MAVTITSKFYQAAAWKDISKVVFTSPNIDSPASAGTRSHILPGEGALGLWYEDTSNMYRIESSQTTAASSYYNYEINAINGVDLDTPSSSITVSGTSANTDVLYEYIKDGLGYTATGYDSLTMVSGNVSETRVKLQYSAEDTTETDKGHLPNIYTTTVITPGDVTMLVYGVSANYDADDTYNYAWVVDQISDELECYIDVDMDKPYKLTKVYMKGHYAYDSSGGTYLNRRFFGNYKILGKLNIADDWVELYDGSNTDNIEATVFLTSNDNFFQYYRLLIEDNVSLDTPNFNDAYYALSSLVFSVYEYNEIPTRTKPLYNFKTNGDADIIYIDSITDNGNYTYDLSITSVSGTGTVASGTILYGWGSFTGDTDYHTQDSIVFEVTTGEAYNCRLTAWDDVTHSTLLNELITGDNVRVSALAFCCSNSKLEPNESFDPNPINFVHGPVYNRILKGNNTDSGTNLYYGDFDMVYRYQADVYGDYLIFKPMLYGITDSVSYGVHDYIITLHYSYT